MVKHRLTSLPRIPPAGCSITSELPGTGRLNFPSSYAPQAHHKVLAPSPPLQVPRALYPLYLLSPPGLSTPLPSPSGPLSVSLSLSHVFLVTFWVICISDVAMPLVLCSRASAPRLTSLFPGCSWIQGFPTLVWSSWRAGVTILIVAITSRSKIGRFPTPGNPGKR